MRLSPMVTTRERLAHASLITRLVSEVRERG